MAFNLNITIVTWSDITQFVGNCFRHKERLSESTRE